MLRSLIFTFCFIYYSIISEIFPDLFDWNITKFPKKHKIFSIPASNAFCFFLSNFSELLLELSDFVFTINVLFQVLSQNQFSNLIFENLRRLFVSLQRVLKSYQKANLKRNKFRLILNTLSIINCVQWWSWNLFIVMNAEMEMRQKRRNKA